MKTCLDYRKDFLCVLTESQAGDGLLLREWYPIRKADETEARSLIGRPVVSNWSGDGIYADEEGNVFELASNGETKPLEVEHVATQPSSLVNVLQASLRKIEQSRPGHDLRQAAGANREKLPRRRRRETMPAVNKLSANGTPLATGGMENTLSNIAHDPGNLPPLNLRRKLALVRRRLGYIQKRGHNEVHNYNYVTAADLAGAVGDIMAELGVLVIPRLESISHDLVRNGSGGGEHLTHVVMNYSFVDVDTAEDITVKVAGEGVDAGDKAPYKAMTGALKYALLQSFLLATGDDPENERATLIDDSVSPTTHSEQRITTKELHELRQLIEDTNTELERVLAYYKLSSLEEMTAATYRRALELLKRKQAKQNRGENAHAQN
jgi:hypothetical protein